MMRYSLWPPSEDDPRLDQALDIAMGYSGVKGRAGNFSDLPKAAALIILVEWQRGVKHPLRLANSAIVRFDTEPQVVDLRALTSQTNRRK